MGSDSPYLPSTSGPGAARHSPALSAPQARLHGRGKGSPSSCLHRLLTSSSSRRRSPNGWVNSPQKHTVARLPPGPLRSLLSPSDLRPPSWEAARLGNGQGLPSISRPHRPRARALKDWAAPLCHVLFRSPASLIIRNPSGGLHAHSGRALGSAASQDERGGPTLELPFARAERVGYARQMLWTWIPETTT